VKFSIITSYNTSKINKLGLKFGGAELVFDDLVELLEEHDYLLDCLVFSFLRN
jgi:hypothetical protein